MNTHTPHLKASEGPPDTRTPSPPRAYRVATISCASTSLRRFDAPPINLSVPFRPAQPRKVKSWRAN